MQKRNLKHTIWKAQLGYYKGLWNFNCPYAHQHWVVSSYSSAVVLCRHHKCEGKVNV